MFVKQAVFSVELKLTNGLCWHSRLSLVAVGADRQVVLFHIDNV